MTSARAPMWRRLICRRLGRGGSVHWSHRGALIGLMILLSAAGIGMYLLRPSQITRMAQAQLAALTNAEVFLRSGHVGIDGAITLSGLQFRLPNVSGPAGLLAATEQLRITIDPWALFSGRLQPTQFTFVHPRLNLVEDVQTGKVNFQMLPTPPTSGPPGHWPAPLPRLVIDAGQLQLGRTDSGVYENVGVVDLSGELHDPRSGAAAYVYRLHLHTPAQRAETPRTPSNHRTAQLDHPSTLSPNGPPSRTPQAEGVDPGVTIRGQVDLATLAITGQLQQFAVEPEHRHLLPLKLRDWWDRLQPTGTISDLQLRFDPDPEKGLSASLQLNQAQITLPLGGFDAPLTNVRGRVEFDEGLIRFSGLKGEAGPLEYHVDGTLHGTSPQSPFQLSIRTENFTLDGPLPPYFWAMPAPVLQQFNYFSPTGTFAVSAAIARDEPGARLTYNGTVQIQDASFRSAHFDYPLEDLRGILRFDDDLIDILDLRGRGETGATVQIQGQLVPSEQGPAMNLVVTALDVPVDGKLYDAIPERYRPAVDVFFNSQAYQRLTDEQVIQSSQQFHDRAQQLQLIAARGDEDDADSQDRAAEAQDLEVLLSVPVFDLGGTATCAVQIEGGFDPTKKYQTTVSLQLAGLNVLFKHWHYPVRLTGGMVVIDPTGVAVKDARCEGLSGGTIRLDGQVVRETKTDGRTHQVPDMQLIVEGLPIDGLLLASMKPARRIWLDQLELTGILDAQGTIGRNKDHKLDFDLRSTLTDGSARPHHGRYQVENLEGDFTLSRGRLVIHEVHGQHNDSKISISATGDWFTTEPFLELAVEAIDLDLNDPITDLFHPRSRSHARLTNVFDTFDPSGLIDAELACRFNLARTAPNTDAPSTTPQMVADPETYRLKISPKSLGFDVNDRRVEFDQCLGTAVLTPGRIELNDCKASFHTGTAAVTGEAQFDNDLLKRVELSLSVDAKQFDGTARALLPKDVVDVMDALQFSGAYSVADAKLHVARNTHGDLWYQFTGQSHLDGAQATVGIPLTEIDADLNIEATGVPDSPWPRLDLRFHAQQLRAVDRLVSPLEVQISSSNGAGTLDLSEVSGNCYGGKITGSGQVNLGKPQTYQMRLTLHDASLDPFIAPRTVPEPLIADSAIPRSSSAAPGTRQELDSSLSASLVIEGTTNNPETRRGRGNVVIRNATLYNFPLAMGLMQVLNLTLPSSRAFDRATAEYMIEGDLVFLEDIRLDAPNIGIAGSGTMAYHSLELDLNLFTRHPDGLQLGLLSDLFTVFKDELVNVHVTGTLDDPKPKIVSFEGIKRTWEDIFGRPKQSDQEAEPRVEATDMSSGQ